MTRDRADLAAVICRSLLAMLGGGLLGLPCVDSDWFAVAWVGFLPLLWAVEGRSPKAAYLLGALAGTVFWASVTYWLADFASNLKGYQSPYNTLAAALFWLYAGQSFGITLALYQWLRGRVPLGEPFVLPIVFVTIFSLYPMLFYLRLGEGQTSFTIALQAADITGAHGIDFMIALAGATLFALVARPRTRASSVALAVAAVLFAGWFGYGQYALSQWDRQVVDWPSKRIGIVQPNDPPSIAIPPPAPGYSRALPPEMEMTARLAAMGAELVVWPEARFKGYFDQQAVRDAYEYSVSSHGAAVLFHDLERRRVGGAPIQHNAAALLDGSGQHIGTYRKMKLFAFGEYAPLISEVPLLRAWVASYFGDFLGEITPGAAHETFAVAGMRVVPKICYESAFPGFVADSVVDQPEGKVIAILSQDGWFGESRQPYQHLWQSALRAVENRVPVVHAINNGPSGVILPNGRYAFRAAPFVRSESVVDMPYSPDSGGSFFSRHPRLFLGVVYAAFGVLVLLRLLASQPAGFAAAGRRPSGVLQK